MTLSYQREWQAANREKCRAYARKYREANRDKVRAKDREYKQLTRSKQTASRRRWRERNLEKDRARANKSTKEWQLRNPNWCLEQNYIRRARIYAVYYVKIKRAEILARENGKCFHCGKALARGWHLDHLIPLSKGGPHTPDNVVASCPRCNLTRYNRVYVKG